MTSTEERGVSSSRVSDISGVDVTYPQCAICYDVLWKPVACQLCETPFCSPCINQWLVDHPNNCPNRCETYTERKCPPFVGKLLAQLKISCFYKSKGCQQIVSYEPLDKHEIECVYQPQQCPGCRSEILKKDFDHHKSNCASIELTCEDCRLVYKRGDSATKHAESICLKEQLRQLRDESKENKRSMQELTHQLNEMHTLQKALFTSVTITFDDLPSAEEAFKPIPGIHRGLKWTGFNYAHEVYMKKKHPKSGYVTSFMPGGSPHIAYFSKEASVGAQHQDKTFTLISLTACAAWNDDLQLTITGHQNSIQINTHTPTLLFGKPQTILLNWKNIDDVTFKPSGGIAHPGIGEAALLHVVITQLTIGPLD